MQTLRPLASISFQSSARSIKATSSTCRAAILANSRRTARPNQHRRTFVTNPFASAPQTLTASRTLPYPATLIYAIIADINAYSTFLPYCQHSLVTRTSAPVGPDNKTYPEEAKLAIGFSNDVGVETFYSRVYCIPDTIVESVSGRAETSLDPAKTKHHSPRPESVEEDPSRTDTILTHLRSKWVLKPYPYKPPPSSAIHPETTHKNQTDKSEAASMEKTDVTLNIEYQFANPVYAALSSAAAPKVAEKMIDAFERRVKEVMDGPSSVRWPSLNGARTD